MADKKATVEAAARLTIGGLTASVFPPDGAASANDWKVIVESATSVPESHPSYRPSCLELTAADLSSALEVLQWATKHCRSNKPRKPGAEKKAPSAVGAA